MEAVAALGVAAAAFQFFDAAAKALLLCKQIRDSEKGTTEANNEQENHITLLKKICGNLRQEIPPETSDREVTLKARDECIKIGDEMFRLLNKFKPSSRSWFLCLRAASRAMRGDKKIRDLQARLAVSQTNFHLAVSVETLDNVLKDHLKTNDTLRTVLEELRDARIASDRNHTKTQQQVTELQTAIVSVEVTAKRNEVLESLRYPDMSARQQNIKPPSSGTFEWIFDDSAPKEDPPRDGRGRLQGKFARWLRSDEPLFWIAGKPGSGKSSLMSLIHDDSRTQDALSTWAGSKQLHTFAFQLYGRILDHFRGSRERSTTTKPMRTRLIETSEGIGSRLISWSTSGSYDDDDEADVVSTLSTTFIHPYNHTYLLNTLSLMEEWGVFVGGREYPIGHYLPLHFQVSNLRKIFLPDDLPDQDEPELSPTCYRMLCFRPNTKIVSTGYVWTNTKLCDVSMDGLPPFDLSAGSARMLQKYRNLRPYIPPPGPRGPMFESIRYPKFVGSQTDLNECLEVLLREIWANDRGLLNAWQQLFVLACVKRGFKDYWDLEPLEDRSAIGHETGNAKGPIVTLN